MGWISDRTGNKDLHTASRMLAKIKDVDYPCFAAPPPERFAMPLSRSFAVLSTALLCACGHAVEVPPAANSDVAVTSVEQTQVARGLSFVEAQCNGCHAVRPGTEPPNPQAPSFVAVANDMGFNQQTLREFFRDGHDDPFAMTILLEEDEAEIATAYIMSLRSPR